MTDVETGIGAGPCFACGRAVGSDARVHLRGHAAGHPPVRLHQRCAVDLAAELLIAVRSRTGVPLVAHTPAVPPVSPLTRSEKRVLALLARGAQNREIARALDRSESTVKNVVS